MNPLLILSVVPLALLGAALLAIGSFGWGVLLWVTAVALSQTSFLADVWVEYKAPSAWPGVPVHRLRCLPSTECIKAHESAWAPARAAQQVRNRTDAPRPTSQAGSTLLPTLLP